MNLTPFLTTPFLTTPFLTPASSCEPHRRPNIPLPERLYSRLAWTRGGEIPGYAFWPVGGSCGTSVFYKTG